MNNLQRLDVGHELLRDPEPDRPDRPGQGDPHDPLLAPGVHPRRRGGPGAPRGDLRREPHPLLRRLLALGLPRGRRGERAERARAAWAVREPCRARSWRRHERLGDLRRLGAPPPPHAGGARVHLPPRDAAARPRRAARACSTRHPLYSAAGRAPVRFRREDYLGDPDAPARRLRARPGGGAHRRAPARPGAPAHHAAHLRAQLQPGLLLLLLRAAAASAWRPWWRR